MRRLFLTCSILATGLLLTPGAQAGGLYRHGYFGPPPYRVHGPVSGPGPARHLGWRYGWRPRYHGRPFRYHRVDRGRYAAGGLLLGFALGNALAAPRATVVERRVVYGAPLRRERAPALAGRSPHPGGVGGLQGSAPLPRLGYRLTRDGSCLFLEDGGGGRTFATEVPVEDCGMAR